LYVAEGILQSTPQSNGLMPRLDVSGVSFPFRGAFRILVNVQHAHTPEALFKFPHQRDVDVDVLKSPSFRLPLAGSSSGLDF
jgi:hypothetical protein